MAPLVCSKILLDMAMRVIQPAILTPLLMPMVSNGEIRLGVIGRSLVLKLSAESTNQQEHSSGDLWIVQHNDNWAYVREEGYAAAGSSAYLQVESDFMQDFNHDSITGNSFKTTESKGSVQLLKDSAGYGYASDSTGNAATTHANGVQWGDKTWSNWSLVGAETISGIKSAWEHSSGDLWIVQHNDNWVYVREEGYAAAGSSAYLLNLIFRKILP